MLNDGDKALVIQDDTLISVAEREMEGIVPLYYEMAKAADSPLTPENIFHSLTSAYKANIGIISNDITKIWNSDNPNIKAVQWLTMYNNFIIDYAKTLFKPDHPAWAEEIIKSFTGNKVPYFFRYAKDKEYYKPNKEGIPNSRNQVEEPNMSTVNKLEYIIPNKPIQFAKIAGKVDYKILTKRGKKIPKNQTIIDKFEELSKKKRFMVSREKDRKQANDYFDLLVREEFSQLSKTPDLVVDILVYYLYVEKDSRSKDILWNAYGDIIVENIKNNLEGTAVCEECLTRFDTTKKNEVLCSSCKHTKQLESKRKWKNSR